MSGAKFQHFNNLEATRYEELKRDIEQRGVLIPIITDEDGAVIDGHQRRRCCAELHIDCPSVVVPDLTEDEKHQLAIVLNLYRRQLSGTERSKVIGELAHMRLSTRKMGAILGMSKSAVQREVAQLGDRPDTVTDSLGREQPSTKPARDVSQVGHVDPVTSTDAPLADENGEPITGGEGRKDEGGSDDALAAGEGVEPGSNGSTPSDPVGEYRKAWFAEAKRVHSGFLDFDPAELVPVLDGMEREALRSLALATREWSDRVDKSLSNPFQVVNG